MYCLQWVKNGSRNEQARLSNNVWNSQIPYKAEADCTRQNRSHVTWNSSKLSETEINVQLRYLISTNHSCRPWGKYHLTGSNWQGNRNACSTIVHRTNRRHLYSVTLQCVVDLFRHIYNPFAAGQIQPLKWLKPWHMGTHLKVLRKSFPMDTNMTGFRGISKIFTSLFSSKVASALEGSTHFFLQILYTPVLCYYQYHLVLWV